MSLLLSLQDRTVWEQFYKYKTEKAHLSKKDNEFFASFLKENAFLPLAEEVNKKGFCFDYPAKKLVNKMETGKKRVVYSFSETENMLLKLLSFLLYRYDGCFSDNLYSFRKNFGVMRAVHDLTKNHRVDLMYGYKLDISNYFNSIDTDILSAQILELMPEDRELARFLCDLLQADHAYFEGKLIEEKRGAMAGIPISPFFANLYLRELDETFSRLRESRGILYARYSDDIILFAETEESRSECIRLLHRILEKRKLSVNREKEAFYGPKERWDFLGISYKEGKTDLSRATVLKMEGKIRRKARALYRWSKKKGADAKKAQKVLIRVFNERFFECRDSHELCWSRWFFPLLTETEGLNRVDLYLQQYIRYLGTGRFSKVNYRTDYRSMKELGYKCLVHEFYRWKESKENEIQ